MGQTTAVQALRHEFQPSVKHLGLEIKIEALMLIFGLRCCGWHLGPEACKGGGREGRQVEEEEVKEMSLFMKA